MCPHPVRAFCSFGRWSKAEQIALGDWAFDLVSFLIGFLAALLLMGLVYRNRSRIIQLREEIRQYVNQLRQRLTASMAVRFSESVIESAQSFHLFGGVAPLSAIYVETRFCVPFAAREEATEPLTLLPTEALNETNRLLIIGKPGAGRTTLLNHLRLVQAEQIRTTKASQRAPVYVYLPALALGLQAFAGADAQDTPPAQYLVQAALSSTSRLIATRVARWLQRQVDSGNALILLDGWDEVSSPDLSAVTAWIQELAIAQPDNRLVVTAGEHGYAPLVESGFLPVRPLPWTHRNLAELTSRWSAAGSFPDIDQGAPPPTITYALTPPTPLEATIELITLLRGQTPANTPAGKMAQVLDVLLNQREAVEDGNGDWPLETGQRALEQLALHTITRGQAMLTREEIQAAVTAAMPPPQFAEAQEQKDEAPEEVLTASTAEDEQRTLQIVDCCRALTATGGPIRTWDNRQHFFAHQLVAAYLAARHLATDGAPIASYADNPDRFDVLRFYVGLASAEPLIEQLESAPDDLFLSHLWTAAELLAAAPPKNAPWRINLIKRLAQLYLNPRLPELLRGRALTALANSRQPGIGLLFRQAASNPDPQVHAGAILGLGAVASVQDLPLIEDALGDENATVRLAAIRTLGILARGGYEPALELVIAAMIEGEDAVQRAAATTLADLGAEGHAVLQEAAQDHDLIVRRAAVHGLSTIDEPWTREMLNQMQLEDTEWLVRNAAAEALARLDTQDRQDALTAKLAEPRAETEPWLINWAAERGEGTGVGEAALDTLARALIEGDLDIRQKALELMRRLADPRTIDTLRQALRDPEPSIRGAALVALDEISRRHDLTITMK